ncbi:MAG: ATP-dependent DNA helicase, partial [Ignavibacteriales bacterium]
VLPLDFNWQVAYGRANYLCQTRWNRIQRELDTLSDTERRWAAGLKLWLARGGSGQMQDLQLDNEGVSLWNKISCQRHGCFGNACTWVKECYLNAARRKLAKADVIVINHALLLSDVSAEGRILPEYRHLVIDEAHNLDRTAFDKLGIQFSIHECNRLLNKITEKRDRIERGYLASLHARFPNLTNEIAALRTKVETARQQVLALTAIHISIVVGMSGSRRLTKGMKGIADLSKAGTETSADLRSVERGLYEMAYELREHPEENEVNVLMGEVAEASLAIGVIADSLEALSDEEVVWVEWDDYRIRLLATAPLEIGKRLDELLYKQLDSAIMVSATLTVGDSFTFIKRRLGVDRVDDDRVSVWKTESPFDYDNNCLGLAVKNIQQPGSPQYAESIAECIKTIARNIDKRTLVLFTSRSLLTQTARLLEEEPGEWTGRIISQYQDGEYGTLIAKLQASSDGILFGTETFWEGVDLPGDMLQCLVVTRLPFRPPSEPLTEAWLEHLKRLGRNGFMDYSLPEAVIRFRQGVGRLIRSETDTGVLVILDKRFCVPPAGMRYSELFRTSIPINNLTDINGDQLAGQLASWFE